MYADRHHGSTYYVQNYVNFPVTRCFTRPLRELLQACYVQQVWTCSNFGARWLADVGRHRTVCRFFSLRFDKRCASVSHYTFYTAARSILRVNNFVLVVPKFGIALTTRTHCDLLIIWPIANGVQVCMHITQLLLSIRRNTHGHVPLFMYILAETDSPSRRNTVSKHAPRIRLVLYEWTGH